MGVEISRLSNGLVVATETIPHLETAALGLWVKSGARNETEHQHGIAHLLEHMAFKGTSRRSAFQIAAEIEDVGGEINAATSVETTSFYARVMKENMPLAVDLLADILTEPAFDPIELEREKHVILQEIGAAHDTPDDVVFDRFTETAFRDQAIGRSILGTPETVQSFSSAELRTYLDTQYGADRMVAVAAGAVNHDAFVREIEDRFGGFRPHATAPQPEAASYFGGDYRENRDLMDAQFVLGFEGRAYHMRDFYAAQLLSMVLGGGMSSRLFQEIREKRGLCYAIYAFHWGFSDTGAFGIHAATGEGDLPKLVPLILEQLRAAGERIDPSETDRARAQYRASLVLAAESPASRASQIARQIMLFGRVIPMAEMLDRLADITPERLAGLATDLFSTVPTVSAIGPVGTLAGFEDIRDRLGAAPRAARRLTG
ncbi:MAG: pitrilysin family protein [Rhizobiaceae bacterium]